MADSTHVNTETKGGATQLRGIGIYPEDSEHPPCGGALEERTTRRKGATGSKTTLEATETNYIDQVYPLGLVLASVMCAKGPVGLLLLVCFFPPWESITVHKEMLTIKCVH